jgi:hypothetical protein
VKDLELTVQGWGVVRWSDGTERRWFHSIPCSNFSEAMDVVVRCSMPQAAITSRTGRGLAGFWKEPV